MPPAEHSPDHRPLSPAVLPPELADFLRAQQYACLLQATDQGTVLVVKVPTPDIDHLRGTMPVQLEQALFQHPAAPVIRVVVRLFDQQEGHLGLETFVNVDDPQQREDYAVLATQSRLPLLFYDDVLTHQITKVVPYHQQQEAAAILAAADRMLSAIPRTMFNFEVAKAAVMQRVGL